MVNFVVPTRTKICSRKSSRSRASCVGSDIGNTLKLCEDGVSVFFSIFYHNARFSRSKFTTRRKYRKLLRFLWRCECRLSVDVILPQLPHNPLNSTCFGILQFSITLHVDQRRLNPSPFASLSTGTYHNALPVPASPVSTRTSMGDIACCWH